MLPVPSTLVTVGRPRSVLYRGSSTRTRATNDYNDEAEGYIGSWVQRTNKTRLYTGTEDHSGPRAAPSTEPIQSVSTQRRQHFARDGYTATTNPYQQSRPLLAHRASLPCNEDNPFRALLRFSTVAADFCPGYLATAHHSDRLPAYVTQYNSAEISSACACLELSIGCCAPTTAAIRQPPNLLTTTASHSQSPTSPQPRQKSSLSRTSQSPWSSPDPATEDATFSRPQEYYGAPPTSDATITATVQGPTSVPNPSKSIYSPTHTHICFWTTYTLSRRT